MTQDRTDEFYMNRCLKLAANGLGNTYPNPFVGSVIVHNQNIIGEGFTSFYGGPHAEVNSIHSVEKKELLPSSTLYVTLEPCAHFGKTPPCSDLIIEHKIPRVVVGCLDPFALVNGEGINRMRTHGIEVSVGILEKECLELNRRFFTFHQKKRPYVILKWAQTANGYFAPKNHTQQWISNRFSKQLVHWWRTQEQAIMVGKNTAIVDNPQLNSRLVQGRNPIRVLIDYDLSTPTTHYLFDQTLPTIIFNKVKGGKNELIEYIHLQSKENNLEEILRILYQKNIQSIIIEGGSRTLQTFIEQNLWDEARVFSSSTVWEDGIFAPHLHKKPSKTQIIYNDFLRIYRND